VKTAPDPRGIFVTGTDTNVGKTVVAAALVRRYRLHGAVTYWKPVQTGIEQDDDTASVRRLAAARNEEVFSDGVRLPRPVSPHLAARLSGSRIEIETLVDLVAARPPTTRWIVEGAGGVLVPLNDSQLMIDLIGRLGLPAVIVSRSGLGTINHTLMTIEALRRRTIRVAGVVMVGSPDQENRMAIERYGAVSVLAELPLLESLTPETLAAWVDESCDRSGRLAEFFE
jgi:dethiobiotin synthase